MAFKDERTLKMMERFMDLHNAGYGIPKIAKMTQVTESTVYRNLQTIAETNHTTRDSLLEVVHREHVYLKDRIESPAEKPDFSKLEQHFMSVHEIFDKTDEIIGKIILDCEEEEKNDAIS